MRQSDAAPLDQAFATAMSAACKALGYTSDPEVSDAGHPSGVITALSGGADSTAVALLADRYARQHQIPHFCVIVDHGLRPESAGEAARVAARMRARDIRCDIHRLSTRPTGGVQAWARAARYALLTDIARDHKAVLVTGHHAGDQAETVYMRLVRGSGLGGVGGMRMAHRYHGVPVLRPLLDWPATASVDVCAAFDCAYESDPSNQDHRFERVRVRALLAPTDQHQLTQLATMAQRLTDRVDAMLCGHVPLLHPAGFGWFDPAVLAHLSPALWRRVIGRTIRAVGGGVHAPSQDALMRVANKVTAGQSATLGGCQIVPAPRLPRHLVAGFGPAGAAISAPQPGAAQPPYLIVREVGRRPNEVRVDGPGQMVFDSRWLVTGAPAGTIRLLGDAAPQGAAAGTAMPPEWAAVPWVVRKSFPVLDRLDGTRVYPQLKEIELSDPVSDIGGDCRGDEFQIRFLPLADN